MLRATCLATGFLVAVFVPGCKKATDPVNPGKGGSPSVGLSLSADDKLARDWLQSLNDYAEVIEKKGPGDQRRAAAAKWQESVRAILALPTHRQQAIFEKFKDEIAVTEARYEKAREAMGEK